VDLQQQIYGVLLLIAAILNIRQPKMLALTAVSALYLLVLPLFLQYLFPVNLPDTVIWYWFLAVVELSYLISAIALCCGPASQAIAAICGWNILAHGMGAWAYSHDGPFYYVYPIALVTGEVCQILACLIMAKPCVRVLYLASQKLKIGKNWDGWHQLVGDIG